MAILERTFYVRGTPKAQPRGRAASYKRPDGTWTARVHNPSTAEGWKSQVQAAGAHLRPPSPVEGPVELEVRYFLPRPKRLLRKRDPEGPVVHTSRPDAENLTKAVLDCLTADGWWRDDSQVWRVRSEKYHAAKDQAPGAEITIRLGEPC